MYTFIPKSPIGTFLGKVPCGHQGKMDIVEPISWDHLVAKRASSLPAEIMLLWGRHIWEMPEDTV